MRSIDFWPARATVQAVLTGIQADGTYPTLDDATMIGLDTYGATLAHDGDMIFIPYANLRALIRPVEVSR